MHIGFETVGFTGKPLCCRQIRFFTIWFTEYYVWSRLNQAHIRGDIDVVVIDIYISKSTPFEQCVMAICR